MFKTSDPALNAAMFVLAGTMAVVLFVMGFIILAPVAIVGGIGYCIYKMKQETRLAGPPTELLQQAAAAPSFPSTEAYLNDFADHFLDAIERKISEPALAAVLTVVENLYRAESISDIPPAPPPGTLEHAKYRDLLLERSRKLAHGTALIDAMTEAFADFAMHFTEHLPSTAREHRPAESATTVILIDLIRDPAAAIMDTLRPFFQESVTGFDAFRDLRATIERHYEEHENPQEFKGTGRDMVRAYLADTPFFDLFAVAIPFSIPLQSYKEHGFLFAKSGHGKSQTMRALLTSLFPEDCALFIIDGNGALIENLDRVKSIKDRLVILDPDETPALNFFKLNVSPEKRMELYFYLFRAIDQSLTPRMATMVSNLVELMQHIPGSNLTTLRKVCETSAKDFPYLDVLDQLPETPRDYFRYRFLSKDQLANQTKDQIADRLHRVATFRKFMAMFDAPDNTFDAYRLMQEKKIVIVNTDRNKLGDDGSTILGRYILAQCLAAAWQRPKDERHLALIVVDEAKTYLDDQSKKILSDARAFGVGLLLASQFPDQLDEGVLKEVVNNTTVKFAGPASHSVVSGLNRDMRTTPDFIMTMKKKDFAYAEWACYVDNLTPSAIKLTVPFGAIEKLPRMSDAEWRDMRARNKERYGANQSQDAQPRAEPRISTPPQPKTVGHQSTVTFPEFGITLPCLLDTGASSTYVPAPYTIKDDIVTFELAGQTIQRPLIRMGTSVGFDDSRLEHAVVQLVLTVEGHTAIQNVSLGKKGSEILIGRSFMAGRLDISSGGPFKW